VIVVVVVGVDVIVVVRVDVIVIVVARVIVLVIVLVGVIVVVVRVDVRPTHEAASSVAAASAWWCRGVPPRECSAWKIASVTRRLACSFSSL